MSVAYDGAVLQDIVKRTRNGLAMEIAQGTRTGKFAIEACRLNGLDVLGVDIHHVPAMLQIDTVAGSLDGIASRTLLITLQPFSFLPAVWLCLADIAEVCVEPSWHDRVCLPDILGRMTKILADAKPQ